MKTLIDNWEKKIDKAIETGKGKFSNCLVGDIKDYRRIISLLRDGKVRKAAIFAYHLDTIAREQIPMKIWAILEKEY